MEEEGVFSGRRNQNPVLQQNAASQGETGMQGIFEVQGGAIPKNGGDDEIKKPVGWAKKLFAGIGLSGLILAAFIAVQLVAATVFLAALSGWIAMDRGVDFDYAIILARRSVATDPMLAPLLTASATVLSAIFAVLFYWLIWGRNRTDADRLFFREKVLKGRIVLMISIAAFGLYYLAVIITAVIAVLRPHMMRQYEDMMEFALGGDTLIILATTVIAAPISEERIVRGLILRNLQKYFSVPVAIIIQAILFGIFHMNWVQGIFVLPVGAALGYTAVKCRSVLPSIYMHMFYNLMSAIVVILPAFFQSLLCCILMPALCAGLVYFLGKRGDDRKRSDVQG